MSDSTSHALAAPVDDDNDEHDAADTATLDPPDGPADSPARLHTESYPNAPARAPNDTPPLDAAALEALLFSTHHPLTAAQIADILELPGSRGVKQAVTTLNQVYEDTGRSFRVEQVAGGYQLLTLPAFGPLLQKLHAREADAKLTKAAQETLAVIAYKQPVLRTDVEAIRGVGCGETIRSLMEKRLVKIAGRADLPGRPILYGTTRRFLESFGLNSLKDLPQAEGIGARTGESRD